LKLQQKLEEVEPILDIRLRAFVDPYGGDTFYAWLQPTDGSTGRIYCGQPGRDAFDTCKDAIRSRFEKEGKVIYEGRLGDFV
jgi:hypothetical protein